MAKSKKKVVYIVRGETGQHDDYCTWNVCAYLDRAGAIEHSTKAQAVADKAWQVWKEARDYLVRPENPFDPDMHMDYGGTGYVVDELKLK